MQSTNHDLLTISSALLATLGLAWIPDRAEAREVIDVSTPAQLEAAVAMPGVIVRAAPGTYALTSNLTLALDTDLIGSNEMIDENGDGVPDAVGGPDDFVVAGTETRIIAPAAAPPGVFWVINGDGWNRVSQLTVVGPVAFRVLTFNVEEVTDSHLIGTPQGAFRDDICSEVSNGECTGCSSKATFRNNVVHDCRFGAWYNNTLTADAQLKVHLSGNRFYRTNVGVSMNGAYSGDTSELSVVSNGNLMENNTFGWAIFGGTGVNQVVPSELRGSSGNLVRVNSVDDVFRNNQTGVAAFGGFRARVGGVFSAEMNDNQVRLDLHRATLDQPGVGATTGDILLFGGNSTQGAAVPGSNNVVEALIRRSSVAPDASPDLVVVNAFPAAPGNEVVLIGSDVAFAAANDPIDVNSFATDFCQFFLPPCD